MTMLSQFLWGAFGVACLALGFLMNYVDRLPADAPWPEIHAVVSTLGKWLLLTAFGGAVSLVCNTQTKITAFTIGVATSMAAILILHRLWHSI